MVLQIFKIINFSANKVKIYVKYLNLIFMSKIFQLKKLIEAADEIPALSKQFQV